MTESPNCDFESNRFDTQASITCCIDGDLIVSSEDVLHLGELAVRLNSLPIHEYTRSRDFIREMW